MRYPIQGGICWLVAAAFLCLSLALPTTAGVAADKLSPGFCENGFAKDGTCLKSVPDEIKASHIILKYCGIFPRREVRGQELDPNLTDQQAGQAIADLYNGTEKKLLALRQKLTKLGRADVEKALHGQMEVQDPDDPGNLMCVLEIVARIYPDKYDEYAKLVKPGVDESDFVEYIRDTYLGKSAALYKKPDKS